MANGKPLVQNEAIAAVMVSLAGGMLFGLLLPNLASGFTQAVTPVEQAIAGAMIMLVGWLVGSAMDYQWIDNMGVVSRNIRPLTSRFGMRVLLTLVVSGVFGSIGGLLAIWIVGTFPGMGAILVALVTSALFILGFDPEIKGMRG